MSKQVRDKDLLHAETLDRASLRLMSSRRFSLVHALNAITGNFTPILYEVTSEIVTVSVSELAYLVRN